MNRLRDYLGDDYEYQEKLNKWIKEKDKNNKKRTAKFVRRLSPEWKQQAKKKERTNIYTA